MTIQFHKFKQKKKKVFPSLLATSWCRIGPSVVLLLILSTPLLASVYQYPRHMKIKDSPAWPNLCILGAIELFPTESWVPHGCRPVSGIKLARRFSVGGGPPGSGFTKTLPSFAGVLPQRRMSRSPLPSFKVKCLPPTVSHHPSSTIMFSFLPTELRKRRPF